jgi:peptide/nickel transport system ATP-binding protein
MSPLLDIQNLCIGFPSGRGTESVQAVENLSFPLYQGATLGLVGESGSGKSTTALSVLRLLINATVSGQILWQQQTDLLKTSEKEIRSIRGRQIAMIFQEPMTALNPVLRCGAQLEENIRLYLQCDVKTAKDHALHWLEKVGIQAPARVAQSYPHEISGGQKQRVLIAMAMAGSPKLLIADEPTTALDVSIQKKIIDLLKNLQAEFNMSMLFISHDLGLISELADDIAVLRQGRMVEYGPADAVLHRPQTTYTQGLLACRPSLYHRYKRLPTLESSKLEPFIETANVENKPRTPLLEVKNLSVQYGGVKGLFSNKTTAHVALNDIHFDLHAGETLGVVGESGSGKTTLGKAVAQILEPASGTIRYKGQTLPGGRKDIQMISQDPFGSLNPLLRIGEALMETIQIADAAAGKKECIQLLETVGLQAEHFHRFPHEFSGGQRQRISIARALAVRPRILICDEITSALDVSVQATILNLLLDLQEKFQLSYLFISHDLSVIRQMSDQILVLKDGRIDAYGTPERVLDKESTGYVRMLLEAVPGK